MSRNFGNNKILVSFEGPLDSIDFRDRDGWRGVLNHRNPSKARQCQPFLEEEHMPR
jgi:hypothetical protein